MRLFIACAVLLLSGCSTQNEIGALVRKRILCFDQYSCKQALANDCSKGGVLYGATPAVLVEYSCNR